MEINGNVLTVSVILAGAIAYVIRLLADKSIADSDTQRRILEEVIKIRQDQERRHDDSRG